MNENTLLPTNERDPLENKILALDSQNLAPADPPPATEKPSDPAVPIADPVLGQSWEYTWPNPPHKKQRKQVEAGTDPHDIKHMPWNVRTCSCHTCKLERGEARLLNADGTPTQTDNKGPSSTVFTPKMCGRLLTLPDRMVYTQMLIRGMPEEVRDIWKTDAEEIEAYEQLGYAALSEIMVIPDMRYRNLVQLLVFLSANEGAKIATTLLVLKTMITQKGV